MRQIENNTDVEAWLNIAMVDINIDIDTEAGAGMDTMEDTVDTEVDTAERDHQEKHSMYRHLLAPLIQKKLQSVPI
jgi:hypothetical protein